MGSLNTGGLKGRIDCSSIPEEKIETALSSLILGINQLNYCGY